MQNRASIRARLVRLEDSREDDLSDCTTPAERLALVAVLTREAWALSKRELPDYSRGQVPVVKVRLHEKK
jgi:hypothetical protein